MTKPHSPDSNSDKNNSSTGADAGSKSDDFSAAHLSENRAVILFRSALVGASTMIPVPLVSDLLTQMLRRGLLKQVASLRHVELEKEAIDVLLTDSPERKRLGVLSMVSGVFAWLKPRGRMRRMVAFLQLLRGIEEGVRIFHLATLLDHYAAHYHAGGVLKESDATKLRAAMDEAVDGAQRDLATEALNGALTAIGRLVMAVPGWVLDKIRRGEDPAELPISGLADQTRELLHDLTLQRYLGRIANTFDKKWGGAAVITVS